MLMILDPPPSSSEMFDFDPHHEEEQAVPGYIQCIHYMQQCCYGQQCYSNPWLQPVHSLHVAVSSATAMPGYSQYTAAQCLARLCTLRAWSFQLQASSVRAY